MVGRKRKNITPPDIACLTLRQVIDRHFARMKAEDEALERLREYVFTRYPEKFYGSCSIRDQDLDRLVD